MRRRIGLSHRGMPIPLVSLLLLAGMHIASAQAQSPGPDFADGLAGGPDYWEVTGVAEDDTLNVRTGPSTRFAVIGEVPNGILLRNLGCRMENGMRWCRIRTLADDSAEGWVSGRYLAEGAGPVSSGGRTIKSNVPGEPDLYIRDTGEVEVNFDSGCGALFDASGDQVTAGFSCTEDELERAKKAVDRRPD